VRETRFSDLCVDVKADAALALLDYGHVYIYDGPKPDSCEAPIDPRCTRLADLRFGSPAFGHAHGGLAIAYAFAPCLGDTFGTPRWFRATTESGKVMFDGTVGPRPRGGLGGEEEFDMYSEGDIHEGGEVIVDLFRYLERKR
jgi:hypothetical protein